MPHATFTEYGKSDTLVSDSGFCFVPSKFKKAMDGIGIYYLTSSPYHLSCNELV